MGKNKQQVAAETRAKKSTPEAQPAAEQPKPEHEHYGRPGEYCLADNCTYKMPVQAAPVTPAQPVPANKQTATFDKLKEGWLAKGINLDKMTVKPDGKFTLVVVAEGWPTVQIGPTGGLTVKELKSYAKAYDAAMDGLALYQKQQAREAKKTAASQPAAPKATEQTATA